MKNKTKNYRISTEKIVFNNGSSKIQYFIEKRSFWFFWKPIKLWAKCLNSFREETEIFLTTDKSLAESLFSELIRVERENIYGVSIIPRIIKNQKEMIDVFDDSGKPCGIKYDFINGKEFEVKYTCLDLIYISKDCLGLQKLKTWDELKLFIGDLPKKR